MMVHAVIVFCLFCLVAVGDDRGAAAGFVSEDGFGGFRHGRRLFPGDDDDAVGIADDDITWEYWDPAEGNRGAETGGSVLIWSGRGDGAGEDGHADLAEGFGVAGGAVQGEPGEAEVDGAFADEFAQQCPGFVSAAGDDDHVPGAGELQCAVDALVVPGACPDGEGW